MVGFILGLILGGAIGIFVMACLFIAKRSENNTEVEFLHQEIEGLRRMIDDYEEQKTQLHQLIETLQEENIKRQNEIDELIAQLWERKNEYKKMVSRHYAEIRELEKNIRELEQRDL